MLREFLVAVAAVSAESTAGRIEVHAVFAEDAAAARAACTDPARGRAAKEAVPLEGDVLGLWNEFGRAAFGFGR